MKKDDQKFFDELIELLREELDVQEPQRRDEFTVRWFAENVRNGSYDGARIFLEKKVKEGKLTVRRRVQLTWGRVTRGCFVSDVYRAKGKNKNVRGIV